MTSETTHGDSTNPTPNSSRQPSDGSAGSKRGPLAGAFGIALSVALLGLAGFVAYYQIYVNVKYEAFDTTPVMYICSETGRQFPHIRVPNEKSPVISPFSNKNTGYAAEKCYWTRDGRISETPTYVLLNQHRGLPDPTICPDCGRPVVPHNPRPQKADDNEIIVPPAAVGGNGAGSTLAPTTQPAGD